MNVNLTPTDIITANREAEAILLLHRHRDVILEALEHSENPLAGFVAGELTDFLA